MIEDLYVLSSVVFVAAGLAMVAMATRAYAQTTRRAMVHLSLGFVLIVAATAATVISAYLTDFQGAKSLLLVNSGISTFGYLFVVYSLISYD